MDSFLKEREPELAGGGNLSQREGGQLGMIKAHSQAHEAIRESSLLWSNE